MRPDLLALCGGEDELNICSGEGVPLMFVESKPLFELLFSLKSVTSGFDSRLGREVYHSLTNNS